MVIPPGEYVCHTCDVRACCNPSHLFVGEPLANIRDMHTKKRAWMYTHPEKAATGDRNGSRKHPELLRRGDNHPARLRPDRMARGESSGVSPLKNADVVEIRSRAAEGESYRSLGRHFKISAVAIGNIVNRKTWRHIE